MTTTTSGNSHGTVSVSSASHSDSESDSDSELDAQSESSITIRRRLPDAIIQQGFLSYRPFISIRVILLCSRNNNEQDHPLSNSNNTNTNQRSIMLSAWDLLYVLMEQYTSKWRNLL